MDGTEMYTWFESQAKGQLGINRYNFDIEPTVTPGVQLGRIVLAGANGRPLVKTDIRPEGLRLHFSVSWQEELSEWLGVPPAEQYRLKSNWVNSPSIGVAAIDFDPYFKDLAQKVIEVLARQEG